MDYIRKHAYLKFTLLFIGTFAMKVFWDYKEGHEFHWMENLFDSLFYVIGYTFMMWLWEDNGHKKGTKEEKVGGGTS